MKLKWTEELIVKAIMTLQHRAIDVIKGGGDEIITEEQARQLLQTARMHPTRNRVKILLPCNGLAIPIEIDQDEFNFEVYNEVVGVDAETVLKEQSLQFCDEDVESSTVLKGLLSVVFSALLVGLGLADAQISNVSAQQRYPWNGKVDISYAISGVEEKARMEGEIMTLKVSAVDLTTSTTNIATSLTGDVSLCDGIHQLTWDMNAQGLTFCSTNVIFNVTCEAEPALYFIVDLSAGSNATSYSIVCTNEMPGESWSDGYKTEKLVLRRIESGTGGSPYYIGVFEVTQKQYELITGETPSNFSGNDKRPVECVSYEMIRGVNKGAQYPTSTDVDADSVLGKLRTRIGCNFDLPTSSQFEYACRAGTTTAYSYGEYPNGEYMWYRANSDSCTHDVGTRKPNAWGLYDMHGNAYEWCLDWFYDDGRLTAYRVVRGGGFQSESSACKSASKNGQGPSYTSGVYGTGYGFRLVLNLPSNQNDFRSGSSGSVRLDLTNGTRITSKSEILTYSTDWFGAVDGARAIVSVDGESILESHGRGTVVWNPTDTGTFELTHKVMLGGEQIGEPLTAMFTIIGLPVETPTINPDSVAFASASKSVTLSCATDGSTIYYTVDGSEPSVANGRVYKGPFDIYQTTTVKAIAVKDDWRDSAMVSATFTKENAIGPAINLLEVLPDNDKTHPWEVVTDITHDGVSAVKSGSIKDEESTTLKAVIYGAGRLSFWWRTGCEPAIDGEYYDFATFFNGTTEVARLAGATDWQQVTLDVAGTGKHTFKWTYQKDDSGTMVPDGVWLDQVQWLPQTDDYYSTHTLTTETPVPYAWLDKYGLGRLTDFETAAKAKSGKDDGAGRELTVEEEYVAGTDPTNAMSQLKAFVDLSEGYPKVTWDPDLNEEGSKALRTYKVWGKEALDDGAAWVWPTNALHRFFKVTVEMP